MLVVVCCHLGQRRHWISAANAENLVHFGLATEGCRSRQGPAEAKYLL